MTLREEEGEGAGGLDVEQGGSRASLPGHPKANSNEYELTLLNGRPSRMSLPASSSVVHIVSHGPSTFRVAAVVAFYIVTSIAMIMVNKAVLNQAGLPLFFLWGQLVVAVVVLKLAAMLRLLTLPPVSLALMKGVAPLIAINVIGLIMNTLCLHHIDAVMYQVARSLILPMTVAMTPLIAKQPISPPVLLCCIVISVGFLVGVFGERNFSVSTAGVLFGVLPSLTTALPSFIIKSSFQSVKHNGAFDLVYYNNLFSALFLAPILILELNALLAYSEAGGWPALRIFLLGTLLAGATGLLINLAGFLQIKTTSPVTHTVSSAARGVLQTLAARAFLGEAITWARSIGIAITLFGSCAYSVVKSRENGAAPKGEYSKVSGSEGAGKPDSS